MATLTLLTAWPVLSHEPEDTESKPVETLTVTGRRDLTATSTLTVAASDFELRPLESGGQLLEVVPNLVTAQHTGGGKAEQYFIRGFDADHGTDLAVYFDGVPINLRSHAHGQGFLDLHFVTPETIERLDAYKGPYFARYGDFATAAAVEFVPYESLEESFVKFEGGSFGTFRAVGAIASDSDAFEASGPAQGFLAFEAYHTDGPFENDEDLWRYSFLAKGHVDLDNELTLSGHLLGYYGRWNASGLIPQALVNSGALGRFGSLDPTEGGHSARVQGKLQLDWWPTTEGHLMANVYVAWYDLELFSNFTYFLVNPNPLGDGIVQRDEGRVYTGGRVEYEHRLHDFFQSRVRGGVEWRHDHANILLGTQTRRNATGCQLQAEMISSPLPCNHDQVGETSVEPYADFELMPLPWATLDVGLRVAWFHLAGTDLNNGRPRPAGDESLWLPKANVVLEPFSDAGPFPVQMRSLRELELFGNFGLGYHSNDARVVFGDPSASALARATGAEVGLRTWLTDWLELAVDYWWLELDQELVFVGDAGTTEIAGPSKRDGIEMVLTSWPTDWFYVRGDVAYTTARLTDVDRPVPQAPRFVARMATGIRHEGFAAELSLRHLGDRYAREDFSQPRLSSYTVLDLAGRYRWRFLEFGLAIENLMDTDWRSSEFYYESRPTQGGSASEDFHFSPGNPLNVRAWVTTYF
ncbi:TonB-dependent receptor plug domain-containing protein [Myxococcota bacterium]|nr:TonB-dependent receptor plug domain-containing protein [Myxococcota bacterium]